MGKLVLHHLHSVELELKDLQTRLCLGLAAAKSIENQPSKPHTLGMLPRVLIIGCNNARRTNEEGTRPLAGHGNSIGSVLIQVHTLSQSTGACEM